MPTWQNPNFTKKKTHKKNYKFKVNNKNPRREIYLLVKNIPALKQQTQRKRANFLDTTFFETNSPLLFKDIIFLLTSQNYSK